MSGIYAYEIMTLLCHAYTLIDFYSFIFSNNFILLRVKMEPELILGTLSQKHPRNTPFIGYQGTHIHIWKMEGNSRPQIKSMQTCETDSNQSSGLSQGPCSCETAILPTVPLLYLPKI